MEEKKIKSALELAMEKIAKMSELTSEELTEQKEREYKPRGEAIANRYLEKTLREAELETELSKYEGREGEIVRNAFLLALCQSIELEDAEKSKRAIEGMQILGINASLDETKSEIERISTEFHREMEQRYKTLEESERGKLRKLWISGSAVRPSLKEKEDFQRQLRKLRQEYDFKIGKVKAKLLPSIESSVQR